MSGVVNMRQPNESGKAGKAISATETIVRSAASLSDGLIVVGADRKIVFANGEAGSILGAKSADLAGLDLGRLLTIGGYDWGDVLEAVADGASGDFLLRGGVRSSVFTTVRRAIGGDGAMVLCLRDLEVFDHQRRIATGMPSPTEPLGAERKVRPDFGRQRQLSPYLDKLISRGERALLQGARVIITGESGVGKTEIARHLHSFVSDASDPFVVVNCAAIPETLFESELFGYEKGSFTGALSGGKKGLIEQAEGGTLFLDEVGEIPIHLQAKLLSFLEDGTVQRVGGAKPKHVHVRVISATNRDLEEMAEYREFRRDLYYRLAVVRLPTLPLRETPELISHLLNRFLGVINQKRLVPLEFSEELRTKLLNYDYPGNIRELYNLVQQISVLSEEDEIPRRLMRAPSTSEVDVSGAGDPMDIEGRSLKEIVSEFERGVIEAAIKEHGSKRKAAEALDVNIGTIVRKTKKKTE